MSLSRAYQVFTAENDLSGANGTDAIRVHVCNRIPAHFEREQVARGMSIILSEIAQIVGYLTIRVGQAHLCFLRVLRPCLSRGSDN
jgi:hypothetical protein